MLSDCLIPKLSSAILSPESMHTELMLCSAFDKIWFPDGVMTFVHTNSSDVITYPWWFHWFVLVKGTPGEPQSGADNHWNRSYLTLQAWKIAVPVHMALTYLTQIIVFWFKFIEVYIKMPNRHKRAISHYPSKWWHGSMMHINVPKWMSYFPT